MTAIDFYLATVENNNTIQLLSSLDEIFEPNESLYVIFRNINDGSFDVTEINENNQNTLITSNTYYHNYTHNAKIIKYTGSSIIHLLDEVKFTENNDYLYLINKLTDYNNEHPSDLGNAIFIEAEYQIILDNINNGTIIAPNYAEYDDKVNLSFYPDKYFELSSWSINGVTQSSNNSPYVITNIIEDKTISAIFSRANYNVSMSIYNDHDGAIALSDIMTMSIVDYNNDPFMGTTDIPGGSTVTITYVSQYPPQEEITDETEYKYVFSSVNVVPSLSSSNNTIVIDGIDKDYNITFNYLKKRLKLEGYDPVEKTYKFEVTLLNTTDIEHSKVTIYWKPTIYQIPNED